MALEQSFLFHVGCCLLNYWNSGAAADATEAKVDDDYVVDVSAAQGAWDPWPTHD